jgi:beta-lactamase regulating signal transducer with metallopeptidase domain
VNASLLWQQALPWFLTYLAHSTLLLGSAWVVTRLLSSERLRLRERIWKTAMIGGLFTATLQLGLDVAPLAGRIDLAPPATVASIEIPTQEGSRVLPGTAAISSAGSPIERFSWQRLLLGVWIAGGTLGVFLLIVAWRRLTDLFAGRRRLRQGPTTKILARLSRDAGLSRSPRLTVSDRLRSPATIGIFSPQICIPSRVLGELSADQQEALLAHELAHIVRRDPLWFLLLRLVERAFFFQPLNSVARRECEEIAEFLSDDWAAQATRSELSLARCLTEVATWVLDVRPPIAVVPMASRNSRLAARIGRLLDEERKPQDHRHRPFPLLLSAAILLAGLLAMPGATALARAVPERPPEGSPEELAPEAGLVELLGELDAALEELAREVEKLGEEFEVHGPSPRQADSYRQLGARVTNLRIRREELHRLVPLLLESGVTNPTPSLNQTWR